MRDLTQEEIQECVNNTVKQALKTLTKDTKQAPYDWFVLAFGWSGCRIALSKGIPGPAYSLLSE